MVTKEQIEEMKERPVKMIQEPIGDMIYWHCPTCWRTVSPFEEKCKCGQKLIPDCY